MSIKNLEQYFSTRGIFFLWFFDCYMLVVTSWQCHRRICLSRENQPFCFANGNSLSRINTWINCEQGCPDSIDHPALEASSFQSLGHRGWAMAAMGPLLCKPLEHSWCWKSEPDTWNPRYFLLKAMISSRCSVSFPYIFPSIGPMDHSP